MKPGIKTTEFWVTLVTSMVMAFNDAMGWGLSEMTVAGIVGLAVTYVAGRSWFKSKMEAPD